MYRGRGTIKPTDGDIPETILPSCPMFADITVSYTLGDASRIAG